MTAPDRPPVKGESLPASTPRSISVPIPITLAAAVIIIAAFYLARDVLIPIALALLLSFLLAPLVIRLRRWGLPRIPAVLVTVGLGFACIAIVVLMVTVQMVKLAGSLPEYQGNIEQKIQSLRATPDGALDRLMRMISRLNNQTGSEQTPPPTTSADQNTATAPVENPLSADPPKHMSVEVVAHSLTPLNILGIILGTTLGPLITSGIVVVFVMFILLGREDIRNRVIRLLGQRPGQLYVTTQALDDAATRVSRYLLMQLFVNVTYGIPIGVGLYFIGVPNPVLWGLLAVVLRFVPFVGPLIAGAFPVALAFAVDPGWSMLIGTILLYAVVEIISNNFIEPWLYGSSAGISSVGILLSALFWGSLWGPIGLLMSTPLTVCLVVLGRHIPTLSFFTLLLGDQPVFPLHARIYQRLLAMDPDEPDELARNYLTDHTVAEFYGEVLVPVLRLLENERHHHALDQESRELILEHIRDLIEDVAERPDPEIIPLVLPASPVSPASPVRNLSGVGERTTGPTLTGTPQAQAAARGDAPPADESAASAPSTGKIAPEASPLVVCIPAHDESDELVGLMLSTLLRRRAIPAATISAKLLAFERLDRLASIAPPVVCISVLPPLATVHARHTVQRIHARIPVLKIVVGFWDTDAAPADLGRRLAPNGSVVIVTTLKQAVENLVSR